MDANALLENAPLIFAISIVGVLGFLLLLAVGLNMLRGEAKPKAASGETPDEPPARRGGLPPFLASLAGRLPRVSRPSAGAAPADAHEVLRVLRHHLTGRVVVEVGGRRYRRLGEIDDDAVRQGLQVTLRDLDEFLAGLPAEPGAATHTPSPQSPPAAVVSTPAPREAEARPAPAAPPAPEPRPASETAPIAAALNPLPPKPAAPAGAPPLRVPSMNPFKQVMVLRELGAGEPPPPKSIADQIDEVLQHLIAGTPFAARSLAVRSGPRGNVIFESDGQAYHAIDDLPDATLQAVFREAVKQWENR